MTLKSLDEFDRQTTAKRARLEKDHALAHALPTVGKTVTWIGEGGWEKNGNTRKPDVERRIDLAPWIVHRPFRGAEHVAFKAPDSSDKGEHVSSKHRREFVRRYLLALLDACEPHMIDIVAIESRYKSNVPESFNWIEDKDYEDAHECSRGLFELEVGTHLGQYGFRTAELTWYIRTDAIGPCQISFELENGFAHTYKAQARPKMSGDRHNAGPVSWTFPNPSEIGAVHLWRRASADSCYSHGMRAPWGYTCQWLYATREELETFLELRKEIKQ